MTAALLASCKQDTKDDVRLAAASDLAVAINDLAPAFKRSTGFTLTTTLGSSGQLAEQLRQGAPFDAFASANAAFALRASDGDACDASSRFVYAKGRIALVVHEGTAITSARELTSVRFKKIAIANPEHAPYGRAAKEAMTHEGVFDTLLPKLVFAENIQQALQWVERGDADAGIIADSLLGSRARFLMPRDPYTPLEQTFVTCKGHGNFLGGAALRAFLQSDEAHTILERNGFDLP